MQFLLAALEQRGVVRLLDVAFYGGTSLPQRVGEFMPNKLERLRSDFRHPVAPGRGLSCRPRQ